MRRFTLAGLVVIAALVLPAAPASAARQCGWVSNIKIKANNNTSCPFARNIARSFLGGVRRGSIDPFSDSTASGNVYSPVTGLTYFMRCSHLYGYRSYAVWGCYGGNSAYAKLTYFA